MDRSCTARSEMELIRHCDKKVVTAPGIFSGVDIIIGGQDSKALANVWTIEQERHRSDVDR